GNETVPPKWAGPFRTLRAGARESAESLERHAEFLVEVGGNLVAGFVADLVELGGDGLDGELEVDDALGDAGEDASDATATAGVDLAGHGAILMRQEQGDRGDVLGAHPF